MDSSQRVSFEILSCIRNDTLLAMMMFNGRYAMAPESIWPGMFQAEAGRGTASVRSTRDAISDTVGQLCHNRRARGK